MPQLTDFSLHGPYALQRLCFRFCQVFTCYSKLGFFWISKGWKRKINWYTHIDILPPPQSNSFLSSYQRKYSFLCSKHRGEYIENRSELPLSFPLSVPSLQFPVLSIYFGLILFTFRSQDVGSYLAASALPKLSVLDRSEVEGHSHSNISG